MNLNKSTRIKRKLKPLAEFLGEKLGKENVKSTDFGHYKMLSFNLIKKPVVAINGNRTYIKFYLKDNIAGRFRKTQIYRTLDPMHNLGIKIQNKNQIRIIFNSDYVLENHERIRDSIMNFLKSDTAINKFNL